MALRAGRGSRLRRAALGRPGFVALAGALYLGAAVWSAWPAVEHIRSDFLADGAPGYGEAAPGDHLQTGYRLWLVGHQLESGAAPWRDPYSFRPEAGPELNLGGWPFGLPYWPLAAAFGPVLDWNLFVLLSIAAAGGLALAWLRELGLGRGAALAGGLAFAIAPYRVAQSAGHLLGPISLLLPLALWAFERGRRGGRGWLALGGAALASIPLSGQLHLALGAIPFFLLYAACRTSSRPVLATAGLASLAATGAGLAVWWAVVAGSIESGGRSLGEVSFYSAGFADLLTRDARPGSESFVFLGWATPLLALAGLVLLVRAGRRGLALALGLGALVPTLLALGTNLPLYSALWHSFPPLRFPRVPERLLPIACLALAGLVAVAASRGGRRLVPALVVAVLLVDLHVRAFAPSAADQANLAYAALRSQPAGRLLELPVFRPVRHFGSVYQYEAMQAQRERPGGYSTVAPRGADRVARRLEALNCGDWSGVDLDGLGVRYVAFHRGLYENGAAVPDRSWFAWQGLVRNGFRPLATDGAVTVFAPGQSQAPPPVAEPPRDRPAFCQGWRRGTLEEPRGSLWVHGSPLRLRLAAAGPVSARIAVDGRPVGRWTISAPLDVPLRLGGRRWHLVTIEAARPGELRVLGTRTPRPRG